MRPDATSFVAARVAPYLVGPRAVIATHALALALFVVASVFDPLAGLLISVVMLLLRRDWQ